MTSTPWTKWLQYRYGSPYSYHEDANGEEYNIGTATVVDWAKELLYNGIAPYFERKGYMFYKNKNLILNILLNYLYRNEGTLSGYWAGYNGRPGGYMKHTNDDMEYYITNKCPLEFWKKLRKDYAIEHFADDSLFAERLWNDLPNLKDSNASEDLVDHLAFDDGGDSDEDYNTTARRADVDPYLMEYGKKKVNSVLVKDTDEQEY
jgi:hypothetical protein